MHQCVVKFSKKNSPQAARGIETLSKILRTLLIDLELRAVHIHCAWQKAFCLLAQRSSAQSMCERPFMTDIDVASVFVLHCEFLSDVS